MSRKTASFGQLLRYVNKPKEKSNLAVLHNLQAVSDQNLERIEREFLENNCFCPARKNGVRLYHEILSFSDQDGDRLTPDILCDIAYKYLEMRAVGALAYAKVHLDTDCPHIHVIISGNLIKSGKKLRISRGRFRSIKKALERYQVKKYPELTHSVVAHGEAREPRRTAGERERSRRLNKERKKSRSKKEIVHDQVLECLCACSEQDFLKSLDEACFEFYLRGKTAGVLELSTGKKYRIKTLGLQEAYRKAQERWERSIERTEEMRELEVEKGRRIWREMEFKEDIFDVLEGRGFGERGERGAEIKNLLRSKRERGRGGL